MKILRKMSGRKYKAIRKWAEKYARKNGVSYAWAVREIKARRIKIPASFFLKK